MEQACPDGGPSNGPCLGNPQVGPGTMLAPALRWGCASCTFGPRSSGQAVPRGPAQNQSFLGTSTEPSALLAQAPEQVIFPEYAVTTNSSVTTQPWLQKAGASSLLIFSNSSEAGPQAQ